MALWFPGCSKRHTGRQGLHEVPGFYGDARQQVSVPPDAGEAAIEIREGPHERAGDHGQRPKHQA